MTSICGMTVIKDGNKLGYPWIESILSVLDQVDSFLIGEGYSDDDTWRWCEQLEGRYDKIRTVRQHWPQSITGFAIGTVTNALFDILRHSHHEWVWLVQSDELYHPAIASVMRDTMLVPNADYDGLLVNFLHLQNNFQELQQGAGYTHAIRAVRNRPYIKSYRDAWTFVGCKNVLRMPDELPVVHANRTYWENIPLKMRSHADTLYPDLAHYKASAEEAERVHNASEFVPELFVRHTSPYEQYLPEIVKPTIGWLRYEPREELLR